MSATFRLAAERRGNDLNIVLTGDFDGDSAWELVNTLMLKSADCATITVDTHQVREVAPFGAALLNNLLGLNLVNGGRIFFDEMPALRARDGGHRLFGATQRKRMADGGCRSRASIR